MTLDELVGLRENEANGMLVKEGFVSRITARDGEQFFVTCEYDMGRVNLEIDRGVVVKATIG